MQNNQPLVLLYDSSQMLRSTFALLAHQTANARVLETAHFDTASKMCEENAFQLMIIGMSEDDAEKHLIASVRSGTTLSDQHVPIVVMTSAITANLLQELKLLNVTEVLLKPTRIKKIHEVFLKNMVVTNFEPVDI